MISPVLLSTLPPPGPSPSTAPAAAPTWSRSATRIARTSPPTRSFSSSDVPSAITCPPSITAIESASRSASSRYCVVSRRVVPSFDELADDVPHLQPAPGVEPGRRLVQEQDLRPADEARAEVQAPAHAARVGLGGPVRRVGQLEALEHRLRPPARLGRGQVVQAPDHLEVLEAREVLVDGGGLAGEPDHVAEPLGVADHVEPGDGGPAAVGVQQRRQDPDGRGLAGAVRAEQAEHGAAAGPGGRRRRPPSTSPKCFSEPLDDDDGFVHEPTWYRGRCDGPEPRVRRRVRAVVAGGRSRSRSACAIQPEAPVADVLVGVRQRAEVLGAVRERRSATSGTNSAGRDADGSSTTRAARSARSASAYQRRTVSAGSSRRKRQRGGGRAGVSPARPPVPAPGGRVARRTSAPPGAGSSRSTRYMAYPIATKTSSPTHPLPRSPSGSGAAVWPARAGRRSAEGVRAHSRTRSGSMLSRSASQKSGRATCDDDADDGGVDHRAHRARASVRAARTRRPRTASSTATAIAPASPPAATSARRDPRGPARTSCSPAPRRAPDRRRRGSRAPATKNSGTNSSSERPPLRQRRRRRRSPRRRAPPRPTRARRGSASASRAGASVTTRSATSSADHDRERRPVEAAAAERSRPRGSRRSRPRPRGCSRCGTGTRASRRRRTRRRTASRAPRRRASNARRLGEDAAARAGTTTPASASAASPHARSSSRIGTADARRRPITTPPPPTPPGSGGDEDHARSRGDAGRPSRAGAQGPGARRDHDHGRPVDEPAPDARAGPGRGRSSAGSASARARRTAPPRPRPSWPAEPAAALGRGAGGCSRSARSAIRRGSPGARGSSPTRSSPRRSRGRPPCQNGSPFATSTANRTSADRVGSNRLVCSCPACAVSRQWTWCIGSPGSYSRTPAKCSRSSKSRAAAAGEPNGEPAHDPERDAGPRLRHHEQRPLDGDLPPDRREVERIGQLDLEVLEPVLAARPGDDRQPERDLAPARERQPEAVPAQRRRVAGPPRAAAPPGTGRGPGRSAAAAACGSRCVRRTRTSSPANARARLEGRVDLHVASRAVRAHTVAATATAPSAAAHRSTTTSPDRDREHARDAPRR